jgi:hypothetical protein
MAAKYSAPSIEKWGRIRSSQWGSHQLRFPRSSMTAGTSRQRTIVASTAMATDSPMPNSLTTGSPLRTKLENTQTMTSAAEVMTRPVWASPSTTASLASPDSE